MVVFIWGNATRIGTPLYSAPCALRVCPRVEAVSKTCCGVAREHGRRLLQQLDNWNARAQEVVRADKASETISDTKEQKKIVDELVKDCNKIETVAQSHLESLGRL